MRVEPLPVERSARTAQCGSGAGGSTARIGVGRAGHPGPQGPERSHAGSTGAPRTASTDRVGQTAASIAAGADGQ